MKVLRDRFFTSIALNYLPKALALAASVFDVYPQARVTISVIDLRWLTAQQLQQLEVIGEEFAARRQRLEFLDPLTLYGQPALFRYKYNVVEACTSVKPAVALHLLHGAETVTYLDPDVILYAPMPAHLTDDVWDFQVTPHVLAPAVEAAPISERLFMSFGTFNLGYFAVRDTAQSRAFLVWWQRFCEGYGSDATLAGLFVDQKPVDLLPCFVDRVSVLRHAGCNAGWWNLFCDGRELAADGRSLQFQGRQHDLVFFHFSNLDREPDVARRLVANPLRSFEGAGDKARLASNAALRALFVDYQRRIAVWTSAPGIAGGTAAAQPADAPPIVRMLLAEAMRRGMDYRGDPFADGALRVGWRSLSYVARRFSVGDLKACIAMWIGAARLTLSASLIRHGTQD